MILLIDACFFQSGINYYRKLLKIMLREKRRNVNFKPNRRYVIANVQQRTQLRQN